MFNIEFYLFEQYPEVLYAYIFALGLCMGSFLNVVALRSLADEEFVKTPSRCPKCGHKLNWYNNIPLFSFIFQRGKCQFCAEPISWGYPLAELFTGIAYLAVYWFFGLSWQSLLLIIIFSFFIIIAIEDFKERAFHDYYCYILIGLSILYNVFNFNCSLIDSILGIICAFVVFKAIEKVGYLIIKFQCQGEGDTDIAMAMGALFGIGKFGYTMLLFCALVAVVSILYYLPATLIRYYKTKQYKPFYSLIGAIVLCGLLGIITNSNLINTNPILLYILMIIIFIGVLYTVWNILTSIKNQEQVEASMLPLGPFLVLASMISVFIDWNLISKIIFG